MSNFKKTHVLKDILSHQPSIPRWEVLATQMREAVTRVRAKREKTLRKHNIVYRLNADSREDVPI